MSDAKQRFKDVCQDLGLIIDEFKSLLNSASVNSQDTMLNVNKLEKRFKEKQFQVAMLALVKSGKSTLLNALMANEFLPVSNVPETARIVRIQHLPAKNQGTLIDKGKEVNGVEEISHHLRESNRQGRIQEDRQEDELILQAPLVVLKDQILGEYKFEVLDTPGPNEAGVEQLKHKVYRLLDDVNIIIYLLDYTKLKTTAEQEMLAKLAEIRPELLKQYANRIFFVVNKIDAKNRHGLKQKETVEYIRDLLRTNIKGVFWDKTPIFLVSAEQALLARLVINNRASQAVLDDFTKRVMGDLFSEDEDDFDWDEVRQKADSLLKKSRVNQLEEHIITFIYEKSGDIFLSSIFSDLERYLGDCQNTLNTTKGAIKISRDELETKLAELQERLDTLFRGLKDIEKTVEETKVKFENSIKDKFNNFRDGVTQIIADSFEGKQGLVQNQENPIASLLNSVLNFLGFDKKIRSILNYKDAERQVNELNQTIVNFLLAGFHDLMGNLEATAFQEQVDFFEVLSQKITPLANQIQLEVGKSLNVKLKPIEIKLSGAVSHDDLHRDIHEAIEMFVSETDDSYKQKIGEDYWGDPIYKTKYRVIKTANITEIKTFWEKQIKKMTKLSIHNANRVTEETVIKAINQARTALQEYADSYIQIIKLELLQKESGKEAREKRLEEIKFRLEELAQINRRLQVCQDRILEEGQ